MNGRSRTEQWEVKSSRRKIGRELESSEKASFLVTSCLHDAASVEGVIEPALDYGRRTCLGKVKA